MLKKLLAVIYRVMEFANNNPIISQLMAEGLDDLVFCVYSIADAFQHWFKTIALTM